jgi:hypothetical protein
VGVTVEDGTTVTVIDGVSEVNEDARDSDVWVDGSDDGLGCEVRPDGSADGLDDVDDSEEVDADDCDVVTRD